MRRLLPVAAALVLALLTALVQVKGSDRVLIGTEGTAEENAVPRLQGGWPAPFLADVGGVSVVGTLGPEDEFRFWPFIATWAFWYCVLAAALRLARGWRLARTRRPS